MLGTFTDGRSLTDPMNASAGRFTATPGVPFPCREEVDNGKTGKDRKVLVKNPCSGDGPDQTLGVFDYGYFCKLDCFVHTRMASDFCGPSLNRCLLA